MTKKQEKEEKKRIRSAFTGCYANFAYEECLKRDKRIRGDING